MVEKTQEGTGNKLSILKLAENKNGLHIVCSNYSLGLFTYKENKIRVQIGNKTSNELNEQLWTLGTILQSTMYEKNYICLSDCYYIIKMQS